MPTKKGILAAWTLVSTTTGIALPWSRKAERQGESSPLDGALAAWSLVLGDTTDDQLAGLTVAWIRSGNGRYGKWPDPGVLLATLRAPEVDDADEAWADALFIAGRARRMGGYALDKLGVYTALGMCDELHGTNHYDAMTERFSGSLPTLRVVDITNAVGACGGWRGLVDAVREGDDATLGGHRKAFRGAWQSARTREKHTAHEAEVAGLLGGTGTGEPRRIAGPTRAS